MNWESIAGVAGGVGAIVMALGALVKSSIERLLDAKLNQMEERNRLMFAETARRQAAVFDEQFSILKELLSATYRLRNTVRELNIASNDEVRAVMIRVITGAVALEEMLIEHRAIIPREIFSIAHRLKGSARIVDPNDQDHLQMYVAEFNQDFSRLSVSTPTTPSFRR